jgi:small-conductance mechanosensitive channel
MDVLPDIFKVEYFNTTLAQWLMAICIATLIATVMRTVTRWLDSHLSVVAPTTDSLVEDVALDMVRRTYFIFQLIIAVATASAILSLPPHWNAQVRTAVIIAVIIQSGMWASGLVNYIILVFLDQRGHGDAAHRTGRNMVRFVGLTLVWSAVILSSLDNIGVSITTLIAGLGVTGIAIAFATQQLLGDLLASISILLDKPFLVGDFIALDSFLGNVDRIGIRSTRLRSLTGEEIILANSDLVKSRLRNFKSMAERRIVFHFQVRYQTPTDKVRAICGMVEKVIKEQPDTRFDRAHWANFGACALEFEVVYYVLSGNYNTYMDRQNDINLGILDTLRTAHIELCEGTPVHLLQESRA